MEDDHQGRAQARADILLRFHELSWQDQYQIYQVIQDHFIHSGTGSEAIRELHERAECVTALQQVATHLQLPSGTAPGVKEYEKGRKELGLELGSSTIIRRWVAWREVCKAARGERVSQTARQRAHMRAAIRRKATHEEAIAGIREWLSDGAPTLCKGDYDTWAHERNEKNPRQRPVAGAGSIDQALVLPWTHILKVAQGHLSLVDAQAQSLKNHRQENQEFTSLTGICLTHSINKNAAKTFVTQDSFPAHVFHLHRFRIWRWSDIDAHRKGEHFPERTPGELQDQVTNSVEIRRLCGLPRDGEHEELRRVRPNLPQPAGRVINRMYWWRSEIESWAREHPDLAPGTLRRVAPSETTG